jgi:hypothetical protein
MKYIGQWSSTSTAGHNHDNGRERQQKGAKAKNDHNEREVYLMDGNDVLLNVSNSDGRLLVGTEYTTVTWPDWYLRCCVVWWTKLPGDLPEISGRAVFHEIPRRLSTPSGSEVLD